MICGKCHKGELTTYATRPFPSNQGTIEYKQCPECGVYSKYLVTIVGIVSRSDDPCPVEDVQRFVKYSTKPHPDQQFSIEYKKCPLCGTKAKFYASFIEFRSYMDDETDVARVTAAVMIKPGFGQTVARILNQAMD